MRQLFSISAATGLVLSGLSVAHAEHPNFEIRGLPITWHQVSAVQSAWIRERSPQPTLTLAGMPASPHQVALLRPKVRLAKEQAIELDIASDFLPVRFSRPVE
jgi:hypothetical protein